MAVVSMKQFLEAGVHFGHQTRRWDPKMSPYIFGAKNGVHIIDLQKTLRCLKDAYDYARDLAARGETILFVGTKVQAKEIIREEAERCGGFYINERWLGGLMTNFHTIRASITKLRRLNEKRGEDGLYAGMIKKEAMKTEKLRVKLERSLGGIAEMRKLPGALFVIDCKKEKIAIQEAQKLGIPIIAVVDTNCSPEGIDHVIPGNDDAIRAIRLFTATIANAVNEGRGLYEAQLRSAEAEQARAQQQKAKAAKEKEEAAAAAKPEAKPAAEKPQAEAKPAAEKPKAEAKPAAEKPKAEPAKPQAEAKPAAEQPKAEAKPEPKAEPEKPKAEAQPEPKAEPAPAKPAAKAEPAPAEAEGKAEAKPEPAKAEPAPTEADAPKADTKPDAEEKAGESGGSA